MANKFEICSAASTRHGDTAITAFDGSSASSILAAHNYELLVRGVLGGYRWKFASKIEAIQVLDPDVHGSPVEPWLYAYQLPTDLLVLRTLKSAGEPIAYERIHEKAFTDIGSEAVVYAHYAWRVPEADWPADFTEYIIQRMEVLFLRGIGERHNEAANILKEALQVTLPLAKRNDAQSQTPVNPVRSPTLEARRGVVTPASRVTSA